MSETGSKSENPTCWLVCECDGRVAAKADDEATARDVSSFLDKTNAHGAPHSVTQWRKITAAEGFMEGQLRSSLTWIADMLGMTGPFDLGYDVPREVQRQLSLPDVPARDSSHVRLDEVEGKAWKPSPKRLADCAAASTRLERIAVLNHSLQDFIEDTNPPNRRALESILCDYIMATEGIGMRVGSERKSNAQMTDPTANQVRKAIHELDDDPRCKGTRPPRIPWSVQLAGLLTRLESILRQSEMRPAAQEGIKGDKENEKDECRQRRKTQQVCESPAGMRRRSMFLSDDDVKLILNWGFQYMQTDGWWGKEDAELYGRLEKAEVAGCGSVDDGGGE